MEAFYTEAERAREIQIRLWREREEKTKREEKREKTSLRHTSIPGEFVVASMPWSAEFLHPRRDSFLEMRSPHQRDVGNLSKLSCEKRGKHYRSDPVRVQSTPFGANPASQRRK